MSNSFGGLFKSFWHTMTSYDRHSGYDSPYRTGRHVPLGQGGGFGGLTSVATASESRADVSSPYIEDGLRLTRTGTAYEGASLSSPSLLSPGINRPYSPGLRGESAKRTTEDGFEIQSPSGEIPMQSFQDGLPPAPPVSHSWDRIDRWAEDHYPELYDQVCEGCTNNDLNELEHQLDCSLPMDVRESLQIHDGQERPGIPTGIIFSGMLLDCEEIVQEWENWRKVNHEFLLDTRVPSPAMPSKALGGSSSQASSSRAEASSSASPAPNRPVNWRQDLLAKQDCVPPNSIQKVYSHPAWIPLVRDWGGNNLAIDLAPGPAGTWGQVILFGRDYDTKYVVARSWSAFLATVADDMYSGKWWVDEDTKELKLREFKASRVEPSYFDILRWRTDQKYGRRAAQRKSMGPGASGGVSPKVASPYGSPKLESPAEPRGRPLQRLSIGSPLVSPNRPGYGKMSPLARVTEETSLPESELGFPSSPLAINGSIKHKENLLELDTPRPSVSTEDSSNAAATRLEALESSETNGQNSKEANGTTSPTNISTVTTVAEVNGKSVKANGKQPAVIEEPMKTIDI
ncbi:Glucan synthesis regulatory protein [Pyricularia oryzae]|nr:Glucan synthesis regulatory protein [Pyricularia oryzae]KAI6468747.1 Glucan synthesis regulatory protein [Pyricularia oryzae]KAI6571822.1 Glucan synthesis regulatory protein [Pyricularia oryzae]